MSRGKPTLDAARAAVLAGHARGLKPAAIEAMTGVSNSTVRRIIRDQHGSESSLSMDGQRILGPGGVAWADANKLDCTNFRQLAQEYGGYTPNGHVAALMAAAQRARDELAAQTGGRRPRCAPCSTA